MKFSISASLALLATVTPALAASAIAEVYIKSELRSDRYYPSNLECVKAEAPTVKVTEIELYPIQFSDINCQIYTEAECKGDSYSIKAAAGSAGKQQKFSKDFYAGSFQCSGL
ncbi:hypothetical protein N7541_009032 [Penicillium brevicompactum]|uniref:Uncharacterized protein n=1 Tax=Penicillium brevicompactum TaxID=5074 RepID=A0A9W9QVP8_PENBR|nr:uncharacterized protein N7506_000401 [Penicillium brevicompactum]KAJ5327925.1 hypothetical protein N7452_008315 [Penicillium brevicompactum]KAJ5346550.1 hypothetical protein N7541_009032 [Penicillium brevicompactum]KAJ5347148.1 hypothetical protein N7506_000401 [Penicillium brevicompactum]